MTKDLSARLRSRRWEEVDAALAEAVEHPEGDRIIADYVLTGGRSERLFATALLGDLRGTEGTAALRQLVHASGPGSRDLRCASLVALAKRCGEAASADLTAALSDRDGTVKDYAIIGLAGAGDGRAWDIVFKRLQLLLRRPSRVIGASEVVMAVAYLVQHQRDDLERLHALVEALRSSWDRMSDEEIRWFAEFWPEALPDGPLTGDVPWPDPNQVRDWVRALLFTPIPIPGHERRRPGSRDR